MNTVKNYPISHNKLMSGIKFCYISKYRFRLSINIFMKHYIDKNIHKNTCFTFYSRLRIWKLVSMQ